MASDLRDGRVDVEGANKLPQSITDKLRIGFCRGGDVLLSHKGSVGYVAIAPEYSPYLMLTPQVTYYRVNEDKLSPEFLSYAFKDPIFQKRLASAAGQQGTRGYVGIRAQRKLTVRFGDRLLQDWLVEAIKPYDDLIENNRRRIALLEEAARMLYREWFVHFRFSGHEHVKITDGLPEGWERRTLVELAQVVMGQSPKSRFYNDTGDGLPFHQGVTDYGFRFVSHRTYSSAVTKIAEAGDILVSVRAPVGRINIARDKIVLGRGLAALRSRSDHQSFLFYALKNHFYAEDIIGTGAIYAATNKDELERQKFLEPSALLLREFEEHAGAIDQQISCLTNQNERLAQARDLLLPHLMNGEVAV
jgi:type I restriction enzyme S subunit